MGRVNLNTKSAKWREKGVPIIPIFSESAGSEVTKRRETVPIFPTIAGRKEKGELGGGRVSEMGCLGVAGRRMGG
jgi:hypothetical protein